MFADRTPSGASPPPTKARGGLLLWGGGVDLSPTKPGLQHLGVMQGFFVDAEHVAVDHDEVSLFARRQ